MAVFACKEFTPCLDPASPVANLTSEASDGPTFLGLFFPFLPENPIGGIDPKNPPTWNAQGCLSTCTSSISQQDADLCAQRQEVICSHTLPPPTGGPVMFFSNLQVCNITCPDGSIFSYRVFAGAFIDVSQAAADEQAAAFACEVAPRFLLCLSSIPGGCLNSPYSTTISNTGAQRSLTLSLLSGSLPPGLTFAQVSPNSALISGTPTATGNYVFTVQASDNAGVVVQKTYTLAVLGITNSPTQAIQNAPYSFQFTAAGGTPPYTFFVASGALPDGLSMDSSGNITGTPTSAATFNFTVQVNDSAP